MIFFNLQELDTAIREEEHDGIDNEAEQTIQEMLQVEKKID